MNSSEAPSDLVLRHRTHPKVLFIPVVMQILLIVAHVLLVRYMPETTNDFLKWTKLGAHGILVVLEIVYFIAPVARWYLDTFEMTTRKASSHQGLLYRNHQEINVERISQVIIERGFLDLIFGSGTIKLYDSANTLGLEFKDVPRVKRAKTIIDETSAYARRKSA